jgi:hypothetical protein
MPCENQFRNPIQEIFPIVIGSENLPALNSPDNHMVQRTRRIYSRFSRHDPSNIKATSQCKA